LGQGCLTLHSWMTTMRTSHGGLDQSDDRVALYPQVVAQLHREGRRADLVYDGVQHAYQKAIKKHVDLPRPQMKTRLEKKARNKITDYLRREHRYRPLPSDPETYADRSRAEVERTRELVEAVRAAFTRLDGEGRRALEARYFLELSDRQAGEAEGVSESTA